MSSEDHKTNRRHHSDEPHWLSGYLGEYKSERKIKLYRTKIAKRTGDSEVPIQQSDYLKPFLLDIANDGLESAYKKWGDNPPGPCLPLILEGTVRPEFDADVIVVGAGMAGLVAAYELTRAGVKVKVLEQTERVGGRVHTYSSENSDLASGLFGEAGAMRIPCANEADVDDNDRYKNSLHYLTDFYITKFKLPTQPFLNSSPNTITNIYGLKEKTEDWERKHFADVWPKWNINIGKKFKVKIKTIDEYYNATTGVVTDQLRTWLSRDKTIESETITWNQWINIWSQFTLESFLESNWDGIVAKIPVKQNREGLANLKAFLPWPDDAIRGYSVLSYTEQLDQSLVQYLRDQLGQWWSDNMHRIEGGMDRLPKGFAGSIPEKGKPDAGEKALQDSIMLNRTVGEVSYAYSVDNSTDDYVEVSSYDTNSKVPFLPLKAKAVIITTPVNILRQITFKSISKTDENDAGTTPSPVVKQDLPKEFYQAIEDIFTGASTKIFIQTKTRFWESKDIKGGFSKTNLPIGQMHYVVPESETETEKGLLLIYTWKTEALLFGAMDKDVALKEAVEEISAIHTEIIDQYDDVGIVHAWYDQPAAQGAYGLLKPRQFNNIRYLWYPVNNVLIAGETFSFAAGWIQGALESGMKSAYQFYVRYHNVLEDIH